MSGTRHTVRPGKQWFFSLLLLFLVFLLSAGLRYGKFWVPGNSLFLTNYYDSVPRRSFYPWLVESSRQLQQGHFPLWCNLEGAGMPLLANYQSTPFNPFNLAFTVFPVLRLLDWLLLFKLAILGLGVYLFGLAIGLSRLSAGSCALLLGFSGYVGMNLNLVRINTEIWLPAGLLMAERILTDRPTLGRLLGLGLISALALAGGNPEAAFCFLLFISLYSLLRVGRQRLRRVAPVMLGLGFGLLWNAYLVFSFLEYLGFGWHIHLPNASAVDLSSLRGLFALFFPGWFGPAVFDDELTYTFFFIGPIPAILALTTMPKLRRLPQAGLCFWIALLLGLGMIFKVPPFSWLAVLPLLNRVRIFHYALFGTIFSALMLAGLGLDQFLRSRSAKTGRASALGVATLTALLALAMLLHDSGRAFTDETFYASGEGSASLLLIAAGAGMWGILAGRRKPAAAVIAALSLASLLFFSPGFKLDARIDPHNWRLTDPVPPSLVKPLTRDRNVFRFAGIGLIGTDNINIIYGLNDWRAYEALYPLSYVRAFSEINGFAMNDSESEFFRQGWHFAFNNDRLDNPLIDRLGIKYLVSDRELRKPSLELLAQTSSTFLYLNPNAWPRVWLKQAGRTVFAGAALSGYSPDRASIRLDAAAGSELVLADQYAPGWRAFARPTGRELRIWPEDGIFRRVGLRAGDRAVEFYYQPWGFRIGLFGSLAGLLVFFLAACGLVFRSKAGGNGLR